MERNEEECECVSAADELFDDDILLKGKIPRIPQGHSA